MDQGFDSCGRTRHVQDRRCNQAREQTLDTSQIGHSIKQYILSHFPPARRRELREEDPLLESGIVDSLGILDVVAFIEAEFNVKVEDEDLTSENFQNIARMARYLDRKRNGVG
jgi:acyl carrier protein